MKSMKKLTTLCVATGLTLTVANASTMYLVPSDTMLSGSKAWVTFDGAYADYIFTPIHAISLDAMQVITPSKKPAEIVNGVEGELRTVFDVELVEEGTYAATNLREFYYSRYYYTDEKGERKEKRFRGSEAEYKEKLKDKAFADNIKYVRHYQMRADAFVSLGEPSDNGLEASPTGLDIEFITHPNDYAVGETAEFILKQDGKPVRHTDLKLERSNPKYMLARDSKKVTTDCDGKFSITWEKQGQYALSLRQKGEVPKDKTIPQKRSRYYVTFEVFE